MELEVELWNSWEIDRQIRLTELKAEQERETGGATGDSGNVNEEPGPWRTAGITLWQAERQSHGDKK